ncbi:hypothetical protein B5807_08777 [Epicoccum nigrum]|uniref:F-box domain-containing protein n=1 Tax=Epicoccum nigrum TaxID=105696 RepID=A0A1Y2LSW6_EPING|nr:hypothetical protein B5807_08777 [Epicoccum nigrum]
MSIIGDMLSLRAGRPLQCLYIPHLAEASLPFCQQLTRPCIFSTMSESQDATTEDHEWIDTDSSEVEADTVTFYHKTDLKRKRSLVLAALDLSQADSHQRKRFRSDLTSRPDLFGLPREIRNRIYDHLIFLPEVLYGIYSREKLEDYHRACNLAQTCRQAKAEYDEEFALRLWNHLHLSQTRDHLTFSRNLTSSRDLVGLKSFKAIIRDQFPSLYIDLLFPLLMLPLHELIIHYSGRYNAPTLRRVQTAFYLIYGDMERSTGPRLITLSWNHQEEKRDITLIERTFETSSLYPKNATPSFSSHRHLRSAIGMNATWPSLKVGLSKSMEVGYWKVKRCSDHYAAENAQRVLMEAFFGPQTVGSRSSRHGLDSMRPRY